jgi:hypothetical protein
MRATNQTGGANMRKSEFKVTPIGTDGYYLSNDALELGLYLSQDDFNKLLTAMKETSEGEE